MIKLLATGIAIWVSILPVQAQDRTLIEAARLTLEGLQENSFAANREYCGLIGVTETGQLISTRARKGRADSCRPRDFSQRSITPIASYHTHGAYDPDADAEVPSLGDLDADTDEGLEYGFMSSPGGRFWIIDTAKSEVRMLCGIGCLTADPDFVALDYGPIAKRYSRDDLVRREAD